MQPTIYKPVIHKFILYLPSEMGGARSAYGGEERRIRGFGGGNLRETDHLGDTGVDGRIILRWIFRKKYVGVWTGSSWVKIRTNGGHL
jgi:hypothetical protein